MWPENEKRVKFKRDQLFDAREKTYILAQRKQTMGEIGERTPPYLKILLTPTVWIAMFCDFSNSIASYMVIIEGPNFFKNVLKQDIQSVKRGAVCP